MTTRVSSSVLANTAVTPGTYGGSTIVPVIAVDQQGRLTSVTNTNIGISSGAVSGLAASATTDTTNAGNISAGKLPDLRLNTVGTAGTYGSASVVPVTTTDAYGRVTSVTNTNIGIAAGAVSGLAASATTDTTNAGNIGSGTLPSARLPASGVAAGTYGSATQIPVVVVDSTGRVTSAANVPIVTFVATGTMMEYSQNITSNYTVSASKNALSAGPITIADGVTVTVPAGSNWTIV